jgi:hypothetical protein
MYMTSPLASNIIHGDDVDQNHESLWIEEQPIVTDSMPDSLSADSVFSFCPMWKSQKQP